MDSISEPLDRCRECGMVTIVLHRTVGHDEHGGRYVVMSREVLDHSRRECISMQSLAREAWPTLF